MTHTPPSRSKTCQLQRSQLSRDLDLQQVQSGSKKEVFVRRGHVCCKPWHRGSVVVTEAQLRPGAEVDPAALQRGTGGPPFGDLISRLGGPVECSVATVVGSGPVFFLLNRDRILSTSNRFLWHSGSLISSLMAIKLSSISVVC